MKKLVRIFAGMALALVAAHAGGCSADPGAEPPAQCGAGAARCACDDGKECTADSYDEGASACVYTPRPPGAPCAAAGQVCDGKQGCAPSGQALWAKRFGGTGFEQVRGLAVGSAGQIAITGFSDGPVDLGGGVLSKLGSSDILIAVFDQEGNPQWSRRFGDASPKYQFGEKVAFDKAGNLLVTGYFDGTLDLGSGPMVSSSPYNIFLAKFDPRGKLLWNKHFRGNSIEHRFALALDAADSIYFAGAFAGALDFGAGPLPTLGNGEVFLAKFDKDGNVAWNKSFGDVQDQDAYAIALDSQGNPVIAGYFENRIDFGGGVLASAGMFVADAFVAKFDAAGRHLFSKRFGGPVGPSIAYAVAIDGSDNIALTGQFSGPVDFGQGPIGSGGSDAFVVKLDAQGGLVFAKAFGDQYEQLGRDVTFDRFGNLIVTGKHSGTLDFGGGPLTASSNGYNFFAAKLAPDGAHRWSRSYGGNKSAQIDQRVQVGGPGYLVMAGHFDDTIDFGLGQLQTAGADDLFLAALIP